MRVAIVGLGPKGLFALERLLDHATRLPRGARLDVHLFEPHPAPGAGPNYDPDQPACLRMNLAAEHLDMWWPTNRAVPPAKRRTFPEWRAARDGDDDDGEAFPSRALAGAYLMDGLATLLEHLPPGTGVALHATRVDAVSRVGGRWEIRDHVRSFGLFDEVLLTTGHARSWSGALAARWGHRAPLIPSVFPIRTRLTPALVPRGAIVAVRGFALTFIDCALALTEGRGGRFAPDGPSPRLRYERHPDEVGRILPFSRSGRPMLAKPQPGILPAPRDGDEDLAGALRAVERLPDGFTVRDDLMPVLASLAEAIGRAAAVSWPGAGGPRDAIETWLAGASGDAPAHDASPAGEWERSLLVATGAVAPRPPWAIGQAWRSLYPAIVARLSFGGVAEHQWPAFVALAAEMERVAFGPPPLNTAKLLALVEAGSVDLRHVRGGRLVTRGGATSLCSDAGEDVVDLVIDAVLPGPGIAGTDDGPIAGLVRDGHVRIAPGRRGVEVGTDGGSRSGRGAFGLSILGRPTEDWIIGNDTLNRTLHPAFDAWARRVVGRSPQGVRGRTSSATTDPVPA